MPLAPGTQLGPYVLQSLLGSGGMGEVYRAEDSRLRRTVAIKVLSPDLATPDRVARFEQEARAASALNHPNILTIHDVGRERGTAFIAMEWVDGRTIREMLKQGAVPLRRAIHLARQVAEGLAKAHAAGIVHRDLKPENVMVTGDGLAKIVDFGIAKLNAETAVSPPPDVRTVTHAGATAFGSVLGTLGYMSPEQASGQPVDFRSDQFALGLLMYELVTRTRPFERPTTAQSLAATIDDDPAPIESLSPDVPAHLAAVVARCLAKNPAERYADWGEFAQALSGLITSQQVPRGQLQGVLDSERFNLLRSLEFFASFGDVELWEVVHRARWQRFAFGHRLYRAGEEGNSFHIIAQGQVEVIRDGRRVAQLGAGTSVGEMAYLAPSVELKKHSTDVVVAEPATTISFTPETLIQLSPNCRHMFHDSFIKVLVRRLHAAHEALAHPRRIF